MKKIVFLFSFLLIASTLVAQENDNTISPDSEQPQNGKNYNQWSIEVEGGLSKPTRPFADGYYTSWATFSQADLGVRYMFNNLFGLKLAFGYNHFEDGDGRDDGHSLEFESYMYRASLQGVINAGSLLHFRSPNNPFNILIHAGMGWGTIGHDKPVKMDAFDDNMVYLVGGITPQLRLGKSIALTLDVSALGTFRQDYSIDGTVKVSQDKNWVRQSRGIQGLIVNTSIGLTFYLGNKDVHADWYNPKAGEKNETKLDKLSNEVKKLKDMLKDTDRDGIPDYLDKEPNTINGVMVDRHGRAIDNNNNNIPDELEGALDRRFKKMKETTIAANNEVIKKLINGGYVNVYFKFNSTNPETYSLNAINYLVQYMQNNPSLKANLIGYADAIGNPDYNKKLSLKRAEKVKTIMVAAGIDGSRLTVTGAGEDDSVQKSSSKARQLVRRVTFKLQ